jgi:hypothetical protein
MAQEETMAGWTQQANRIERGLQCPDCYGIHTETASEHFECTECGCQWRAALCPDDEADREDDARKRDATEGFE